MIPSAKEFRSYFDYPSTLHFTGQCFSDLKLPKFELLMFTFGSYREGDCSNHTYDILCLVEVVLAAAKQFQECCLKFGHRDVKEWLSTVVQRSTEIIQNRIAKNVKILRPDTWFTDAQMYTAAEERLKWQEIQLDFHRAVGKDEIRKFFKNHLSIIKELKILNNNPSCSIFVDFPVFDFVKFSCREQLLPDF
ncbi:unnamed protein product [Orchesella dallaii]|uniref:Uncharacterized protein n=1 Tax=Orchesella dallaii TaxID=48710 RepID=A0ABP1QJG2_9HEXA